MGTYEVKLCNSLRLKGPEIAQPNFYPISLELISLRPIKG